MKLTFPRENILQVIAHTKANPEARQWYDGTVMQEPHLWLVGDEGVYFCSPSVNMQKVGEDRLFVVYARECNPTTMDFDSVWNAKRASFGGDDGTERIKISDIEGALGSKGDLEMDLSPTQFKIYYNE